jgi:hypothetical protein
VDDIGMLKRLTFTATAIALTSAVLLAQGRLRPGQYEMTTEMSTAGKARPAMKAEE